METLKIDKKEAIKEFPKAPQWFQKVLISTFGAETFSGNHIDRLTSFEAAYELADDAARKEYDDNPGGTSDEVAYKKLKLITRVANTDPITGKTWIPDWDNTSQKKWFPFFRLSSGFGFAYSDFDCDGAGTAVGSRLCTNTSEKALYIGEQYGVLGQEYKDFFLRTE